MKIIPYSEEYACDIATLFHRAVHSIDRSIYTEEQQEAWAPTPPDMILWKKRLAQKRPYLAIIDDQMVGFMELDEDGHIDCAYTDPDYQQRGIASALLTYVEARAKSFGVGRLYVEASKVARPFFEKRGFQLVRENEIIRRGVVLINYSLEKPLSCYLL